MNLSFCLAYSDSVLSGETYSFQANSLEGEDFDSSDYQFFWMASDGTPASSWNRTFHWTAPVVYESKNVNITLYVTRSDCGCTGKDQAELVVLPKNGDISLEKTHAAEQDYVQVGDVVDYRITVTNTGLAEITSLQLVDDYPEELMQPLDADRAWDEDNQSALTWNNLLDFPLASGQSSSVTVQFEVTAASNQMAINLARALGTMEGDGAKLTAETADGIMIAVSSNCSSIGPTSGCAGIPVAFSAPEGLDDYAWTALNASGESVGEFDDTSKVSTNWTPPAAGTFLISYGDEFCSHQITVNQCQSQKGSIALEKTITSAPDDIQVGDMIDYRITITNIGHTRIVSLPLIDDYPEQFMRPLDADRPWVVDNLSALAWDNLLASPLMPGQSIQVNIAFQAVAASDQTVTNIARVIGAVDENGEKIDSRSVDCLIGSISKINCPSVGPVIGCVGVPVTFSAPAGLDIYSWTAVDASGQSVGGFDDASNATAIWTPPFAGTFVVSYNNMICSQKIVAIQCRRSSGAISLTKTLQSGDANIKAGDIINFNITVTNNGQAKVVSLPLVDDYPEGYMTPLFADQPWIDDNLSALSWDNLLLTPLERGRSIQLSIAFRAIAGSGIPLTNTARVVVAKDENGAKLQPQTANCIFVINSSSSSNCTSFGPESGCVGVPMTFSAAQWQDGYEWIALNSSGRSVGGFDDPGNATAIWTPPALGTFTISCNDMVCSQQITVGQCRISRETVSRGKIRLEKTLLPSQENIRGGDIISFRVNITNIGQADIVSLPLVDDYPEDFMRPLGSDRSWDDDNLSALVWNNLLDSPLQPDQSVQVNIDFQAIAASDTTLSNIVRVMGAEVEPQADYCLIPAILSNKDPGLYLSKKAEKDTCSPQDMAKYTIIFANDFDVDATDVTVYDVLPDVEFINSTPDPDYISGSTLIWKIGTVKPRANGSIEILVRIKEQPEMIFEESQSVSGTGYVYSRKRLSTCTEPFNLENYANITAFSGREFASSTATITVSDAKGTEVKTTSHGSGAIQKEQEILLLTKNKTIQISTSLSERQSPTSFALSRNRSVQYDSGWSEAQTARNRQTGTSIEERYSHAASIDRNSSLLLDKNGSTLKAETTFQGVGHLAMVKLPSNDTSQHRDAPTYESREDYLGSFQVSTEFDEYGKNMRSRRAASGTGAESSDSRMARSQRSYDSGTGAYQAEDEFQTQTSNMAREINATHGPIDFIYSRNSIRTNVPLSSKWRAGMWSRSGTSSPKSSGSAPASFISEEISDADYLNSSTLATGLNKMNSSADFSGTSRFTVAKTGSDEAEDVAFYEEYRGRYQVTRSVEIGGVARFDQPHLSVSKEGRMESAGGTIVDYVISIGNDGNQALGPVHVWDLFPPQTEYVYSSLRPSELNQSFARWDLSSLGIGETSIIELRLNMTEYSDSLVNRVQASGGYEDKWIATGNFSVIELNWLGCSQMQVYAAKTARIDAEDPTLVHYRILLKNREEHTVAASISDQMPEGMMFQNSSVSPTDHSSGAILWDIVDLQPGETREIEYEARALHGGAFVNLAHIEFHSLDGSDSGVLDVESSIEVGGQGKSSPSTWQPPQCFGLNCIQQDFGDEWMPCYTCGAVEPEPSGTACSCASKGEIDVDIP